MRRSPTYSRSLAFLFLLPLLPAPRPLSAQPAARPEAQAQLRDSLLALVRRWGQAYVHEDTAFVAGFVAEDWQGWFEDHADNKASVMAAARSGTPHSLENIVDQATVHVFGQAAVLQARESNRVSDASGGHWVTRHITDVLVHRPEGWVVVASHDSRIPNP